MLNPGQALGLASNVCGDIRQRYLRVVLFDNFETRPARLLAVMVCLILPPVVVALVFNPFLQDWGK